jgi:hypothetical protein
MVTMQKCNRVWDKGKVNFFRFIRNQTFSADLPLFFHFKPTYVTQPYLLSLCPCPFTVPDEPTSKIFRNEFTLQKIRCIYTLGWIERDLFLELRVAWDLKN